MKLLLSLLFGISFSLSQYTHAHGDHEHQQPRVISEAVALIVAKNATISMVKSDAGLGFGQLSEAWADLTNQDRKIYKQGYGYYVVSVFNQGEQKTLYVLMSDAGKVYDANMTGEFDGIE